MPVPSMNSAPKPKTSPCFDSSLGCASAGFGAAEDLVGAGVEVDVVAGFDVADSALAAAGTDGVIGFADAAAFGADVDGAGAVFDAVLVGAAAAFFGAALAGVVFFGAAEAVEAADLLVAVDLVFVLTVLAFSLLVEDAGAVDMFAGGVTSVTSPAGRAAPDLATGDFRAGLTCFDPGDGDNDFTDSSGFEGSASLFAVTVGTASLTESPATDGVADAGSSNFEPESGKGVSRTPSVVVASPDTLAVSGDGDCDACASTTDVCCAAASISEDVITLRFAGETSVTEDPGAGLDDDLETGLLAVFPTTFFLEPAIASTS